MRAPILRTTLRAIWFAFGLGLAVAVPAFAGRVSAHLPLADAAVLLTGAVLFGAATIMGQLSLAHMRGRNDALDHISASLDQIARKIVRKEPDA